MNEIKAYKCGFCGKIYEKMNSCKSHEYRCYFNPQTKSCASCAFSTLDLREYKSQHILQYRACLVNIPISKTRLQTKCEKYLNKKYMEDNEIMDLVRQNYDFKSPFNDTVGRLNKGFE